MPLTAEQRAAIESDLAPYGYALSDSDTIITRKGDSAISISVKRSRLHIRIGSTGSLLFSGPISTGAGQFIREFWSARPIDEQ